MVVVVNMAMINFIIKQSNPCNYISNYQNVKRCNTYARMTSFINFGIGFVRRSTMTCTDNMAIQLLSSPQVSWYSEPSPSMPSENRPSYKMLIIICLRYQ